MSNKFLQTHWYKRCLLSTSFTAALWTYSDCLLLPSLLREGCLLNTRSIVSLCYLKPYICTTSSRKTKICKNSLTVVPTWNDELRRSTFLHYSSGFVSRNADSNVRKMAAAKEDTAANSDGDSSELKRGDKILVEVMSFGKLGASVRVVGKGGLEEKGNNSMDQQQSHALGRGLILQKEIHYFRLARDGIDVVRGEILPAYVENIREDHKIDVSLRPPGGMAKSRDVSSTILDLLLQSNEGTLNVGDKSSPEEINALLPGTSKLAFKKAVSALYKQKKIIIQPTSISLVQ